MRSRFRSADWCAIRDPFCSRGEEGGGVAVEQFLLLCAMEERSVGSSNDSFTKKGAVYNTRYVWPIITLCFGCSSTENRFWGRGAVTGKEKRGRSEAQSTHSLRHITPRDPITSCVSSNSEINCLIHALDYRCVE